jgi:hypothetical protein
MFNGLPKDATREWEEAEVADVGVDDAATAVAGEADVGPPGCHGSAFALRGVPNTKGLAKGLRESRLAEEFPAEGGAGGAGAATGNGGGAWPYDEDE